MNEKVRSGPLSLLSRVQKLNNSWRADIKAKVFSRRRKYLRQTNGVSDQRRTFAVAGADKGGAKRVAYGKPKVKVFSRQRKYVRQTNGFSEQSKSLPRQRPRNNVMGNRFCYEARKSKQSRLPLFLQMSGTKCLDGQSPQKMTEFARRCRPDRDTGRGAFGDFTAAICSV